MTYLIIPKTTLAAVSKAVTMPTRTVASSPEIATAVRMARKSTRRISFSTKGWTKLVGTRSLRMKPTSPVSLASPAAFDALVRRRATRLAGGNRQALPGLDDVAGDQPEQQGHRGGDEEVPERPAPRARQRASAPSEAIPITTVTKITGAAIVFTNCRKASASHLAFVAWSGATSPKMTPALSPIRTQNHSCLRSGSSPRHLESAAQSTYHRLQAP